MMAKKPEDRFQTADEVAQALERWAGGGAGPATAAVADAPKEDKEPAAVELIGDDEAPGKQDVGEVSISVVSSGSFSSRAGSSRGRRPSEAKKPVQEPAEVLLSDGFFSDPRKKWAVIILAGVLLLGGVGGGLAWMMGGDSSQPGTAGDTLASAQPVADAPPAASLPESEPQLDSNLADLDAMFGKTEGRAKELPADDAKKSTPAAGVVTEKPAEPKQTESPPQTRVRKRPRSQKRNRPRRRAKRSPSQRRRRRRKPRRRRTRNRRRSRPPRRRSRPQRSLLPSNRLRTFPGRSTSRSSMTTTPLAKHRRRR